MEIKTIYYRLDDSKERVVITIPVLIIDKEIMPNKIKGLEMMTTDKKLSYNIIWLDKYDKDFREKHDTMISVTDMYDRDAVIAISTKVSYRQSFYLRLNWWQRIKMKVIWEEYWIVKDNRLENAIFFIIGSAIATFIAIQVENFFSEKSNDERQNKTEQESLSNPPQYKRKSIQRSEN